MTYLSVCSGIEAASVAWEPLGMTPVGFAEIDRFPSAVLAHRFPHVTNYGDFTGITDGGFDILVGGTPCQSFSVAGLRGGLADDRGNLALEFCRLALRTRPRWVVWENVPGVLSSNGGRDFGAILGGLAECGYGFAYRILDAQYFGVPQRRRRVFVVGHLGDWRRAAAVLFERHSLQGHPPPSREKREGVAPTTRPSTFECGGIGSYSSSSSSPLLKSGADLGHGCEALIHCADIAHATTTHQAKGGDPTTDNYVAHSLRGEGFDASEDGTGRGTPLVPVGITIHGTDKTVSVASFTDVAGSLRTKPPGSQENSSSTAVLQPIAFDRKASGRNGFGIGEVASTMRSMGHAGGHQNGGGHQAVAVALRGREGGGTAELSEVPSALRASGGGGDKAHVLNAMQVRRLTPRECERLQGFPDDYTLIPYRNKPAADGPRYKALGNSMAVPVMRWIGKRLLLVDGGDA